MSKGHPTPWRVNYWSDPSGDKHFDDDKPILDANGAHVVETDYGCYPPDEETSIEIVNAVNAYSRPRRVCDRFNDASGAEKAMMEHFQSNGMVGPQTKYWIDRIVEFLFAVATEEGGAE